MPKLEVSCGGHANERRPANVATVSIDVTAREADNETAARRVTDTSKSILQDLKSHSQYSRDVFKVHLQRLTTYTRKEYDNSGKGTFSATSGKHTTIYYASTKITIKYETNFDAMSTTVPYLAKIKLVSIENIRWSLDPTTIEVVKGELRQKATQNAIQAARAFFHAAGVDEMHMIKLTEPNSIGSGSGMLYSTMGPIARASGVVSGSHEQTPILSFEPEDIEISVDVSTDFEAEAPLLRVHQR